MRRLTQGEECALSDCLRDDSLALAVVHMGFSTKMCLTDEGMTLRRTSMCVKFGVAKMIKSTDESANFGRWKGGDGAGPA